MTNAALRGKPDAGNPHVRFDEGEVASAATPRRGSLLYRKTMKKLTQGATRLLVLALGLGLVSTGWAAAPTPTVVWRNNLGESYTVGGVAYKFTHDSYNASVGSSVVNGNIVMSDSTLLEGATLDLSGVSNLKKVSVLVKYSGMVTPNRTSGLVSVKNADNVAVGLMASGENATNIAAFRQTANLVENAYQGNLLDEFYQNVNPAIANVLGAGYFLFSYDSDAGASGYIGSSLDTLAGGNFKNDVWNTSNVSKLTLGGSCYYDPFYVWPNLVIEEVYLFIGQCLSNSDVASYDLNTPTATPPTPIAIFNGFSTDITKSGDYSLERNNNAIGSDGAITLSKGIVLTSDTALAYKNAGYTVVVKYSDLTSTTSGAFITSDLSNDSSHGSAIGLYHTDAGMANGVWQDLSWDGTAQNTPIKGSIVSAGVLSLSLGSGSTYAYDKNGNTIYKSTGLHTGADGVTGGKKLCVGSFVAGSNYNSDVLSGMKVEGVAVFDKRLSDSEVSAFNTKVFSKIIAANATWSTITSANFNGDSLPTNDTWADVTINVTENAILTLDSAVSVGKITFNVLPNKTLTLSGAYSITASNGIYVKGGGTLDKGNATLASAMTISDENTTVISTSMPSANVSIGAGSTYMLKDCAWTGNVSNIFTGAGTLYLNTTSSYAFDGNNKINHSVMNSTFSGILKVAVPSGRVAYFNDYVDQQLKGCPSLVLACGTQESQGRMWVGGRAKDRYLSVKNLSGWGIIEAWSNLEGNHYVATRQEEDTTFSGTFVDFVANTKKMGLTVTGGAAVKSLSLTAANETSGPLEVRDNGKVIFSGSGSWNNGATTVKQGGVIESRRSAQVVGALTLESGAKITINGSNYFQAGAITAPDNGTVTLDVSDITALPTGTSAATVLKTTTTNLDIDNKFALAGANANYYLAQNTTSGDVTIQMYAAKDSNDVYYKTASAAFDAIVADHSLTVTILDGTEASHDSELAEKGLAISGTQVQFIVAEILRKVDNGVVAQCTSLQDAFDALDTTTQYLKIYDGGTVTSSALNMFVLYDNEDIELTLTCTDLGYGYSNTVGAGGMHSIQRTAGSAAFTWNSDNASGVWNQYSYWKISDLPAGRAPGIFPAASDSATFLSSASVEIQGGINYLSGITIDTEGDGVALIGPVSVSDTAITVGAGGIVLRSLTSKLTTTRIALSCAPTTTDNLIVKSSTEDRTKNYWVVPKIATAVINGETVEFDDIDDALAAITSENGVIVTIVTDGDYASKLAALHLGRTGDQVFYLAAEVITYPAESGTPYASVENAIANANVQSAQYVMAYKSATANTTALAVLIKCADGIEITLNNPNIGYGYTKSATETFSGSGIYIYSRDKVAASFIWKDSVESGAWSVSDSWTSDVVGNITRVPESIDTVTFSSVAEVLLSAASTSARQIIIGSNVQFVRDDENTLAYVTPAVSADEGIVLSSVSSSLTVNNVTLSTEPSTSIEGKCVKSVTVGSATTYTVADHKATVYDSEDAEVKKYDTVADAVSAATDGQKVTLFANSNEAITLNGKSITFNEGSYTFSGTFTGNGTLTLGSTLKSASSDRWAAGWTGTVVLPAGSLSSPLNFNLYGNSGSVVQITGAISGYLPNAEIVTTVKIPSDASLTLTAFSPSYVNTLDKITGEGTLAVPVAATTGTNGNDLGNAANWGAGYNYSAYLLVKDVSEFTGSLTADQAAGIAIGTKPHKNTVGGKIIVSSGATAAVGAGATWTAGTIQIDGDLTLATGGVLTGSVAGSGTLAYSVAPNSGTTAPSFNSSLWTGTVELPSFSSAGIKLAEYGTGYSKIKLNGITGGYLHWTDQNVQAEVVLAGNVNIEKTSSRNYTFACLSGTGNFAIATGTGDVGDPSSLTISKIASGYEGSIANNTGRDMTVTKVMLAEAPSAGDLILATTTPNKVSIGGVYVGETQQSLTLVKKSNGIYVADAVTIIIPSVDHATVSVDYVTGGVAANTTAAGNITVDESTSLTATWTAASGYRITANEEQTINPVVAAQTLMSPTVEELGATVSNVAVSYGSDYTSATVTATVSDASLDYYISWANGEPVKGTTVSGSTVTFDVSGIVHSEAYQSSGYAIAAKDGETAVTTTGGTGSTVAADVVAAGWINENADTHGQAAAGGSWTNAAAVTYAGGAATITDNRFEATEKSTTSRVVMEFKVCFTDVGGDISGEAQGALKLGEVGDVTTFMVLKPNGVWDAVSHEALTPDPTATNKVVMTFDYANNTYSVSVDNYELTDGSGSSSFPLAAPRTYVQTIDFAGTGTLVSMKGDQLEGYMVKDAAGHWYATIEAATSTYDSANGTYTVLHDGTVPSGWKIDDVTKALIKAAKGLFFMAY